MQLFPRPSDPTKRQLALFAAAWLVLLAGLGAKEWLRGRAGAAEVIWAAAAAAPLSGLASPRVLRRIYLGLGAATHPVGVVVAHVLLAAIYGLVLTPLGLLLRLFRHDPLSLRPDPSAASHWKPREPAGPPEGYFEQR